MSAVQGDPIVQSQSMVRSGPVSGARRSIDSVQYLRGFAAIAVLLSHALDHPLEHETRDQLVTGRLGVLLFFVISGFIMVYVTGAGRFDALSFLAKRIVRVVPFYWAATFVTAFLAVVAPTLFKTTVFALPHFIASLFFVPAENPSHAGTILPLIKLGWTLNYEMFFYIVFACLAGVLLLQRMLVIALMFCALVSLHQFSTAESPALSFYTAHVLLGFVAGVILGTLHQRGYLFQTGRFGATGAALVGAALLIASYVFQRTPIAAYSLEITLIMIVGCALVVFVGLWVDEHGFLPRFRLLHFFGDASYSIYLIHMFGVAFAVAIAKHFGVAMSGWSYAGVVVAGLFAGLGSGCLAYLYVERPLTRFFQGALSRFARSRRERVRSA